MQDAIKTIEASPSAPKNTSAALEAIACDVTDQESVSSAVAQIQKSTGYVDVLINNAGVLGPTNGPDLYKATSVEQLRDTLLRDFDGWETAMKINTQAVVGVSAAFLPLLEAANTRRGWAPGKVEGEGVPRVQDVAALEKIGASKDDDRMAHIITTSSVAAYMRATPAGLAYNASKAATSHVCKILATLFAPWGIRSNIIAPGPYPSDMTRGRDPKFGTGQVPQGRMGNVNDVAGLLLFLVGKGGAYINGTVQVTDGGRLGVLPGTY